MGISNFASIWARIFSRKYGGELVLKFFLIFFSGFFRTMFSSIMGPQYLALSRILDVEKSSRKASEELERFVSRRINSLTTPTPRWDTQFSAGGLWNLSSHFLATRTVQSLSRFSMVSFSRGNSNSLPPGTKIPKTMLWWDQHLFAGAFGALCPWSSMHQLLSFLDFLPSFLQDYLFDLERISTQRKQNYRVDATLIFQTVLYRY